MLFFFTFTKFQNSETGDAKLHQKKKKVGGGDRRLELADKNQIPAFGGGGEVVSAYLKSVGSRDCATVTVTSLPFSS